MFPDYENSVVNLMGSLAKAMGAKPIYEPLAGLDSSYLEEKDVIITMNIDAMGIDLLQHIGKNTVLGDNVRFELTSIFPSTTACATVAYQNGMAAYNHGLTGWFVHLKEIGATSAILPFCPRYSWDGYDKHGVNIEDVLNFPSFFSQINRPSYCITSHKLINTPVTRYLTAGSTLLPFKDLKGFAKQIVKTAKKKTPQQKYIYAYWSMLDHIEHQVGPYGSETKAHFAELCQMIELLQKKMEKINYILLISTDHGMLEVTKDKVLKAEDFPELKDMLNLPFAGEPRLPYCYVKPEYNDRFRQYVNSKMADYCEIYSRQEIIEKGWFGKGKENPKFRDRIGDFVLVMKDNYVLKDNVLGGSEVEFKGYHGGITPQEMRIPLIILENEHR